MTIARIRLAGLTSLIVAALALWFGLTGVDAATEPALLPSTGRLPPAATTGLLLGVALCGVVAAAAGRWLVGAAVVSTLTFGVAYQSITTISLAGYLLALALPVALVVLVVQTVRRYRRLRLPVLAVAVIILALGIVSGALTGPSLVRLGQELAAGFVNAGPGLLRSLVLTVATLAWVRVLLAAARSAARWRDVERWVVRHRVTFTVLAALGPLPYALARLTWLTPWPQFAPAATDVPPELRLWGLLLGGAALVGCVLTIGLVRPWSERFPRWMPRLAGRAVPVAAAAVPGGVVAAIVCASALPMLVNLGLEGVVMLPLWFWGPMLALAVWGYVGHRATTPQLAGCPG